MRIFKAIKKPTPISIVFVKEAINNADFLIRRRKEGDKQYEVYNEKHRSWIGCDGDDYLNISEKEDVYPIAQDYFKEHYTIEN